MTLENNSFGYEYTFGYLTKRTTPEAEYDYGYDKWGRGTGVGKKDRSTGKYVSGFGMEYDDAGRITSQFTPIGDFSYNYSIADGTTDWVFSPNGYVLGTRTELGATVFTQFLDSRTPVKLETGNPLLVYSGNGEKTYDKEGRMSSNESTFCYDEKCVTGCSYVSNPNDPGFYGYQCSPSSEPGPESFPVDDDFNLSYDGIGRLTGMGPYGFGYDSMSRLSSMSYKGAPMYSYEYDTSKESGYVTGVTSHEGDWSAGYTYDMYGQLTRVDYDGAGALWQNESYSYDADGNRTSSAVTRTGQSPVTKNYSYDARNRLTSINNGSQYQYDANGNMTSGGGRTFTYDSENKLKEVNSGGCHAEYGYDAVGRRDYKKLEPFGCLGDLIGGGDAAAEESYVYDGDNPFIQTSRMTKLQKDNILGDPEDGSTMFWGLMDKIVRTRYRYAPGVDQAVGMDRVEIRMIYNTPAVNVWKQSWTFKRDRLGSIIALVDEEGNVAERFSYDSFGNPMVKILRRYILDIGQPGGNVISYPLSSPQWKPLDNALRDYNYISVPFNFTGREYDLESGLYYYRARYYDPEIGRFTQEDPVWSANLYAFVGNNPVNAIDPFGASSIFDLFFEGVLRIGIEIEAYNISFDINLSLSQKIGKLIGLAKSTGRDVILTDIILSGIGLKLDKLKEYMQGVEFTKIVITPNSDLLIFTNSDPTLRRNYEFSIQSVDFRILEVITIPISTEGETIILGKCGDQYIGVKGIIAIRDASRDFPSEDISGPVWEDSGLIIKYIMFTPNDYISKQGILKGKLGEIGLFMYGFKKVFAY